MFARGNDIYNIASENELAEILSHYNSEFIFSIVNETINTCCDNPGGYSLPNAVAAWEQNFKSIIEEYGSEARESIQNTRHEVYLQIINIICNRYKLSFTIDDTVDIYAAAYNLYEFFISKLANNIINFFSLYIYNNKNELYESMSLSESRRGRDGSTSYAKRVITTDEPLMIVISNIDSVISNIMQMDIGYDIILQTLYPNNYPFINYMTSIVFPMDNSFFDRFTYYLKGEQRASLLTMIRFALQGLYMGQNNIDQDTIMSAITSSDETNETE